jgi:hypothetical protein
VIFKYSTRLLLYNFSFINTPHNTLSKLKFEKYKDSDQKFHLIMIKEESLPREEEISMSANIIPTNLE